MDPRQSSEENEKVTQKLFDPWPDLFHIMSKNSIMNASHVLIQKICVTVMTFLHLFSLSRGIIEYNRDSGPNFLLPNEVEHLWEVFVLYRHKCVPVFCISPNCF